MENSVLTLPDGIADESGLVEADRLACFVLMAIWGLFIIGYSITFIVSRNRLLKKFNEESLEEMKNPTEVVQPPKPEVLAWDEKFENCGSSKSKTS